MPAGRNRGKMFTATKRIVINGTPRKLSMKMTDRPLATGSGERRPSASTTAIGMPKSTEPVKRMMVNGKPPHSLVGT